LSLPLNSVVIGDCTEIMQGWPADSIDLVVTSPPYWGLRDYGKETVRIWGGLPECEHEWGELLPAAVSRRTNIGFEERSSENYSGGGHKAASIAVKYRPSEAGKFCIICGAWRGSLGLEPHPQLFIDHLVEVCREVKRVLKSTGVFFLNLGDTYYGSGGKGGQYEKFMPEKGQPAHYRQSSKARSNWLHPKQLLLMPSRIAIALQYDGWILRSDVIWHKSNYMPSSVKDRLTNAYEHVFMFVKARRYYFDLDAIRVPQKSIMEKHEGASLYRDGHPSSWSAKRRELNPKGKNPTDVLSGSKYLELSNAHSLRVRGGHTGDYTHPRGKNPGDLWRIATTPFPGTHFATFPPKLIEPIVKAGSPRWICSKCGKPRTRITEPTPEYAAKLGKSVHDHKDDLKRGMRYDQVVDAEYFTVGWSDCGCGEPWVGGVVFDPFCGSGTALRVARRLGRRFIGIDIVPEYVEMARRRIRGGKYREPPEGVTPLGS